MSVFRQSRHPLVKWWWEMDRISVLLIVIIMITGAIAVTTASVAVGPRYNVGPYFFAFRHYVFLLMGLVIMLAMTSMRPDNMRVWGIVMFGLAYIGIILTFVMGAEVKGAKRWIEIAGQSIQPTEFMKPALILITAALLEQNNPSDRWKGFLLSVVLMAAVALPVLLQPNFGMVLAMGTVWFAQVFMAGMPLVWLLPLIGLGVCMIVGSYTLLPHVRDRIERF